MFKNTQFKKQLIDFKYHLNSKPGWFLIIGIFISVVSFSIGLLIRWPDVIASMARNENIIFLIFLSFPYFYSLIKRDEKKYFLLLIASTFFWFALPLRAQWQGSVYEYSTLGGVLPWSDASDYLGYVYDLLGGKGFNPRIGFLNRTLFIFPFAFLYGLFGQNLRLTLTVISFLTAICVFFLTDQTRKSMGGLIAAILLQVLWVFHARFTGVVLSESLAYLISCLAAAFMLWSAREYHISASWIGIAFTALALNIRPGAFFIIPFQLVWGILFFRKKSGDWKRFLVGAVFVLICVFGINMIYSNIYTEQIAPSYGQLPFLLWGLASGNRVDSWKTIYPELLGAPFEELSSMMYSHFFQSLKENPLQFIRSFFNQYRAFFLNRKCSIFSYISQTFWITIPFSLFSLAGTAIGFSKPAKSTNKMLSFSFLGVLLTVPIINYVCIRPYAPVIPFIMLMPFTFLSWLWEGLSSMPEKDSTKTRMIYTQRIQPIFAGIIAIIFIISPFAINLVESHAELQPATCPTGLDLIYIHVRAGNVLHITESTTDPLADQIALKNFRHTHMLLEGNYFFTQTMDQIGTGISLAHTYNHAVGKRIWLIAETPQMHALQEKDIVPVCGVFSTEPRSYNLFFYSSLAK